MYIFHIRGVNTGNNWDWRSGSDRVSLWLPRTICPVLSRRQLRLSIQLCRNSSPSSPLVLLWQQLYNSNCSGNFWKQNSCLCLKTSFNSLYLFIRRLTLPRPVRGQYSLPSLRSLESQDTKWSYHSVRDHHSLISHQNAKSIFGHFSNYARQRWQ